ncbi:MAG: hypothetical protein RLY93_18645 [Sumerlaeia bacterium]
MDTPPAIETTPTTDGPNPLLIGLGRWDWKLNGGVTIVWLLGSVIVFTGTYPRFVSMLLWVLPTSLLHCVWTGIILAPVYRGLTKHSLWEELRVTPVDREIFMMSCLEAAFDLELKIYSYCAGGYLCIVVLAGFRDYPLSILLMIAVCVYCFGRCLLFANWFAMPRLFYIWMRRGRFGVRDVFSVVATAYGAGLIVVSVCGILLVIASILLFGIISPLGVLGHIFASVLSGIVIVSGLHFLSKWLKSHKDIALRIVCEAREG